MNKLLNYFLLGLFVFAVTIGGYKTWKYQSEIKKLNNQLAESQKIEQETKSAWSIAAQKVENLESTNKDLQKKIEDRDEQVAALGSATLKWKQQYFKIKNAKQTIVDQNGQPTQGSRDQRIRVDFQKDQDFWKVSGFCLTSPPEVEVSVDWSRPLQLSFVLTKKNDKFKFYLDSNSPDVVSVENLTLKVDPSVFERHWYEKIVLGFDFGLAGSDPLVSVRGTYDLQNFAIGPFISLFNGPEGLQKGIGFSFNWRLFDGK